MYPSLPAPIPSVSKRTCEDGHRGVVTSVCVSDEDADALRILALKLDVDPERDPTGYARRAHHLSRRLLPWLLDVIYDFEVSGGGLLRLRNLPTGPSVPTPSAVINSQNQDQVMGKLTAIIGAALGHIVGYRPESSGSVLQALIPVAGHEDLQVSTSSRATLEFHVEQTFNLLTRPDFILLGTNRGAKDAATYIMPNTALLTLPDEIKQTLTARDFYAKPDPSFVRGGVADVVRGPMPLLYGATHDPQSNFDLDSVVVQGEHQEKAVEAVKNLWDDYKVEVVLCAGDLVVLDQSRVIHGRSAFRRRGDGLDRWVARVQVLKSDAQTRFARNPGSPIIESVGF